MPKMPAGYRHFLRQAVFYLIYSYYIAREFNCKIYSQFIKNLPKVNEYNKNKGNKKIFDKSNKYEKVLFVAVM